MPIFDYTQNSTGITSYTAGDGISIQGNSISAKVSVEEDNATQIYNGAIYTPVVKPTAMKPQLIIYTAPSSPNIDVVIQKAETKLTLQTNENGAVTVDIPLFGTWDISATLDGEKVTNQVAISTVRQYIVTLSKAVVCGVLWDKTNTSTQLSRLTIDSDPNSLVTVDITTEPQPAVGTGAGNSPFDQYLPWAGMEEYNIIGGAVSYKKGEPGFSRTMYNTVVYIPEFYYQVFDTDNVRCFYVSDKQLDGFKVHPGSNVYVGRYLTGIDHTSTRSGLKYDGNISRSSARSYTTQMGTGWQVMDYATWCAIGLLYIVEFADWNSQLKIGFGTTGTQDVNTGNTDPMTYHTGYAGANGKSFIQYRNIEAIYGTTWQWLDGINIRDNQIYICNNPANFSDSITQYYSDTNTAFGAGSYIKSLAYSNEYSWVFVPASSGGSSSTYIPDDTYGGEGLRVLMVGSSYSYGLGSGMYIWAQNYKADSSMSYAGWRLEFRRSLEVQR